jgi:hypothetical protein
VILLNHVVQAKLSKSATHVGELEHPQAEVLAGRARLDLRARRQRHERHLRRPRGRPRGRGALDREWRRGRFHKLHIRFRCRASSNTAAAFSSGYTLHAAQATSVRGRLERRSC